MWKGTEVAVKVIAAEERAITKEMQRSFKDEVEVMTALRHPNVVLFMAASTKPPRMCIVMEFMSLGSLYDLIHNELIPDIPLALKVRLGLQAAKGMHFLHSSGIVHRDLKSLNLLLDAKWNLKVSDFGLTRFKGDLKDSQQQQQGSIHWMAPEILAEETDIDFVLADIYAFGIILWELLTREQPYAGLTPAAIAVAVIRDDARPNMPEGHVDADYEKLITDCWHRDPTVRPTFLEVMTRLSAMVDDGNSSSSSSFTSSKLRQTGSGTFCPLSR
jgi:serine/threonine protein kinase